MTILAKYSFWEETRAKSAIGRAIKSRGRERERDIAGGNRRGSCSWRRYASHETKLIEKKQFVEGRRGRRRRWKYCGSGGEEAGLLKESIPPSLVAATREFFAARLTPSSRKKKKKKRGGRERDSRGSPWREWIIKRGEEGEGSGGGREDNNGSPFVHTSLLCIPLPSPPPPSRQIIKPLSGWWMDDTGARVFCGDCGIVRKETTGRKMFIGRLFLLPLSLICSRNLFRLTNS